MNIEALERKIHEITSMLSVYLATAKEIEHARKALENSGFIQTERETRLNILQAKVTKSEQDLIAQRNYIEEQVLRNTKILAGITKERELLHISVIQKEELSRETATLAAEKKILEERVVAFEKEKILFKKQHDSTNELIEILNAREKRVKASEARLQMLATA